MVDAPKIHMSFLVLNRENEGNRELMLNFFFDFFHFDPKRTQGVNRHRAIETPCAVIQFMIAVV